MNNRNLLSNVHLTLLGLLPLTRRWRRCMRNDVVKRRDTDRRFRFLVQGQEARRKLLERYPITCLGTYRPRAYLIHCSSLCLDFWTILPSILNLTAPALSKLNGDVQESVPGGFQPFSPPHSTSIIQTAITASASHQWSGLPISWRSSQWRIFHSPNLSQSETPSDLLNLLW